MTEPLPWFGMLSPSHAVPLPDPSPYSWKPLDLEAARLYERRMIANGVMNAPILVRAQQLREIWAGDYNLVHTENATSIAIAAADLNASLAVS